MNDEYNFCNMYLGMYPPWPIQVKSSENVSLAFITLVAVSGFLQCIEDNTMVRTVVATVTVVTMVTVVTVVTVVTMVT